MNLWQSIFGPACPFCTRQRMCAQCMMKLKIHEHADLKPPKLTQPGAVHVKRKPKPPRVIEVKRVS